ncbi:unnamed protein product [Closterium sp. Naga37s-1]|nr:unnamed protein product [Closterium sp. Naga37s-1]
MVYHSSYTHLEGVEFACGCPLLPLKATARGPTHNASTEESDIVDEAITLFRANVLFRRFDIRGPADKLLVYLTLYINMALKRIDSCPSEAEGIRLLINLGLEPFPIPGDPGFPLAGLDTADVLAPSHSPHLPFLPLPLPSPLISPSLFSSPSPSPSPYPSPSPSPSPLPSPQPLPSLLSATETLRTYLQSEGGDEQPAAFSVDSKVTSARLPSPQPLSSPSVLATETLRTYLQSVREETSNRLLQLVYLPDGSPNKWWLSFSKRKFMNVAMPL